MAVSVREGAISSTLLLRRLRAGSRKNATYTAFQEVGRVMRTVQLLRYLSDAPLRRRVTAATNKVEAFNGFSQWIGFGNGGVITDNDAVEQEKTAKFNALLTNAVIFHNALDIAEIVRQLQEEGHVIDPGDLAHISPYLTEHVRRFGEYSTQELGLVPEAYDPHLDVDFSPLRGDGSPGPTATSRRHDEVLTTPHRTVDDAQRSWWALYGPSPPASALPSADGERCHVQRCWCFHLLPLTGCAAPLRLRRGCFRSAGRGCGRSPR
ncbi:Tn3 family transposase [Streptomyces sp. NPDC048196]|uniref:Tn3 family transposase n=1 Tax=Streptomyces sp. NPDC048196 TaxID=3154712 RepID=UPI0033FD435F